MMRKIAVLDGYTVNPGDLSWEPLTVLGETEVFDRTPEELIVPRIQDCEIVLTNKTPLSRQTLELCPKLKYIGVLATGYNIVDIAAAREKGMVVTNVPDYATHSVAQHTIALLLEMTNQVGKYTRWVQKGNWCEYPDFSFAEYPILDLAGKTLGIVGYGKIGKAVAKLAVAFGMRVMACARHPFVDPSVESVSLQKIFQESDIISLHCPLTRDTQQIINEETISQMRDGVMLLNTSRGGLVEESALKKALQCGKVRFAAIDVVSDEPMSQNNPLLHAPNVIITPHNAWASKEARTRLLKIAIENIVAFHNGNPQNVVKE